MHQVVLVPKEEWDKMRKTTTNHQANMPFDTNVNPPPLPPPEMWQQTQTHCHHYHHSQLITVNVPTSQKKTSQTSSPSPTKKKIMAHHQSPNQSKNIPANKPLHERRRQLPPKLQPMLRLDDFSKKYQEKAAHLLKKLNESGLVAYNSKIELVYKGNAIQDSNIIALVEHAVKQDKTQEKQLKGQGCFYQLLNELNIPYSYYYDDFY